MACRWVFAFAFRTVSSFAQLPKDGIPGPCSGQQTREYPGVWVKSPDDLSELARGGYSPSSR
jgi:hypothetical protein